MDDLSFARGCEDIADALLERLALGDQCGTHGRLGINVEVQGVAIDIYETVQTPGVGGLGGFGCLLEDELVEDRGNVTIFGHGRIFTQLARPASAEIDAVLGVFFECGVASCGPASVGKFGARNAQARYQDGELGG